MKCPRENCGGLLLELEGVYKYKCSACSRYFRDVHPEKEKKAPATDNLPAVRRSAKRNGHDAQAVLVGLAGYVAQIDQEIERLQDKKLKIQDAMDVLKE